MLDRIMPWLAVAAMALAITGAAYWIGGQDARRDADDLRGQIETQRRMDDAANDLRGADDAHVLDWLRRRGQ